MSNRGARGLLRLALNKPFMETLRELPQLMLFCAGLFTLTWLQLSQVPGISVATSRSQA